MQIHVTNYGTSTNVSVVNPATGERSTNLGLAEGEMITLTAVNEHEASGIEVSDVESIATEDGTVPSEDGEASEPAGEPSESTGDCS